MDVFERKVCRTVEQLSLLSEGESVLVALSGGPDSTALILVLDALAPLMSLKVAAAHINHGLRGEESDRDEEFVRKFCAGIGVELRVQHLRPHPGAGTPNLEASLREERYERLGRIALETGSVLATGHSLRDQAETVLMKLIRGAGPTGLAGISPVREYAVAGSSVKMVRPLIEVDQADILGYLGRRNQSYCLDRTNEDLSLDRNWIRHKLIPLLEERLNPAVVSVLARSAGLFLEIEDFLDAHGQSALQECLLDDAESVLDVKKLLGYPGIIQRAVVRRSVEDSLGSLDGVTFAHVDSVLSLVRGVSGRSVCLPGGWRAVREFKTLRITRRVVPARFEFEMPIPGEVFLEELKKRVVVRPARDSVDSRGGVRGDLMRIPAKAARIRNWRPGDRFQAAPGKSRRLKKIFLEKRIAAEERPRQVLLICEGRVVWAEGIGTAFPWRVSGPGENVLEILVF